MNGPVVVRIDRLVLHGVPPADRYRIADAMSSELSRLLAQGGVPGRLSRGTDVERLQSRPLSLPAGATPHRLGQRLATAVYGALEAAR